jgi:transposase
MSMAVETKLCPVCGMQMLEVRCEDICPNCGFKIACSD